MLEIYGTDTRRRSLFKDVLRAELLLLVVLTAVAILIQYNLELTELFPWKVVVGFIVAGTLTLILAVEHLPTRSFGPANQVTLARAGLIALLFGLIGDVTAAWFVVIVASAVLVLDGVDGWAARRFGVVSGFGARFDMEADAFVLAVLSVLVWQYGKAGPWILLAGFMRYFFVAATCVFAGLRRPLPPRRRRQTAFVFQAIALIVSVSPIVVPPLSGAIGLVGLIVLTSSFAADVVYLATERTRTPAEQSP